MQCNLDTGGVTGEMDVTGIRWYIHIANSRFCGWSEIEKSIGDFFVSSFS